jgi:hypothetical protein
MRRGRPNRIAAVRWAPKPDKTVLGKLQQVTSDQPGIRAKFLQLLQNRSPSPHTLLLRSQTGPSNTSPPRVVTLGPEQSTVTHLHTVVVSCSRHAVPGSRARHRTALALDCRRKHEAAGKPNTRAMSFPCVTRPTASAAPVTRASIRQRTRRPDPHPHSQGRRLQPS